MVFNSLYSVLTIGSLPINYFIKMCHGDQYLIEACFMVIANYRMILWVNKASLIYRLRRILMCHPTFNYRF